MFLFEHDPTYTRVRGFDEIHQKLRANGCHCPTTESTLHVFDKIKSLAMLSKLSGLMEGNLPIVSGEAMLRQLNGSNAQLDFTGNGYEFSGWYTELVTLTLAGVIEGHGRLGFRLTHRSVNELCRTNASNDEIHQQIIKLIEKYEVVSQVRQHIILRLKRFELINLVLDGTYAGR